MKQVIFVFWIFISMPLFSQVQFCKAGAEWGYCFGIFNLHPQPIPTQIVKIKYVRDSIIGIDTVKVLDHDRYFPNYNDIISKGLKTIIKQKGDTVFFRSKATNHTWQILINYATPPGFCWQTTVRGNFSLILTFNYCVDSVKYVLHNGQSLRTLYMNGNPDFYITEMFGSNAFLFNFALQEWSDGDFYEDFLYYKDNSFGTKQFSTMPCGIAAGLSEDGAEQDVALFPNPVSKDLTLTFPEVISDGKVRLEITNALGQIIKSEIVEVTNKTANVSVDGLVAGLYQITIEWPLGWTAKKFLKVDSQ